MVFGVVRFPPMLIHRKLMSIAYDNNYLKIKILVGEKNGRDARTEVFL